MKKNRQSKLRLSRETLHQLEDRKVAKVAGGDLSYECFTPLFTYGCSDPVYCGQTCTNLC